MFFIEKNGYQKFCIWKDEMPIHYVSQDNKSLCFDSGEVGWHEGTICLEAYLRPTDICNYAMIGMSYKSDPKADTANIVINYGEEDISFNSQVLPSHKEVSVGLERKFVEAVEEFFVEYASKYELPGGTIEILFVGYDGAGSSNISFKQTMELMIFLFKNIDHMEYEQLEKKILKWKYKNGKLREMNKSIFHDNLMKTIYEIVDEKTVDEKKIRFKIIPVYRKEKHYNGTDDVLRLLFLSDKNIGNRLLSVDTTVKLVAGLSPYVPVWINISFDRMEEDKMIFNFETSLNVRKPSLLINQETGHAPFKAIKNE